MHNGEKNVKTRGKGDFDPGCVIEIYDTLTEHNYALRAFGALLRSSDLTDFNSENCIPGSLAEIKADDLRYGLSQIIEVYIAKQEQILNSYVDQYEESDFWRIKRASQLISLAGAYASNEMADVELREAHILLENVIARGGDLSLKAASMKESILQRITPKPSKPVKERRPVNSLKMDDGHEDNGVA